MSEKPPNDAAAHLAEHRALILMRSALVGAASALPVPGVSELLAAALRRGLLLHVAGLRHVDLDDEAVAALVNETPKQKRLSVFSALGTFASLLRRRGVMRRLFAGLALLHAIEEALRMVHRATLLDHYCAQHHVGLAVHGEEARQLRAAIDEAVTTAQRELFTEVLSDALSEGRHLAQVAPGWLSEHLAHPPTPATMTTALLTAAHHTHEFLRDLALRRYMGRLVQSFDQRWPSRRPAGATS